MAGVGVFVGKLKRHFILAISICCRSFCSPIRRSHDSALFNSVGMLIFSCSSSKTAVSIRFNTSLDAFVVIEDVSPSGV